MPDMCESTANFLWKENSRASGHHGVSFLIVCTYTARLEVWKDPSQASNDTPRQAIW